MMPEITKVEPGGDARVAQLPREVPAGWAKVELHEVVQRLTDGTHQPPKFSTNGVPFVVIGNINGNSIHWPSVSKWVSHDKFELEAKRLRPRSDDILYTAVGTMEPL
jgi:type I restriction enzyme, S subunit